jgi:hypothetical protein
MARLTDEIVDEIHAVRSQHAASLDNDMDSILDDLAASQQRRVAQGWPLVKSRDAPSEQTRLPLQSTRFVRRSDLLPPT